MLKGVIGLQKALEIGIKNIIVEGDSLLVINQMTGKNTCRSTNLIDLYNQTKELIKEFEEIYFSHIFRSENKRADELCNNAVLEYLKTKNK